MAAELFFIYDSHCPWSYVSTALVAQINQAYPTIKLHLLHSARYQADDSISEQQLNEVTRQTDIEFGNAYRNTLTQPANSIMAANLLAWVEAKANHASLPLLSALQKAHFEQGRLLSNKADFDDIVAKLKLSPPAKVFNVDKFSKDAEQMLIDIEELQELIQTQAIPALLLAVDDELVLLNHNLYLAEPKAIIDAIALELK